MQNTYQRIFFGTKAMYNTMGLKHFRTISRGSLCDQPGPPPPKMEKLLGIDP
jgi:hypothetical protein